MAGDAKVAPFERFAIPDDHGEIQMSDLLSYDRLRVITDAQHFIVPVLFFLAALFAWLALRLLFAGSAAQIRRLIGLWLEVKLARLRAEKDRLGRSP